ncbi:MAG: hypothetical protein IJ689_00405 [Alphaproteobacteria bacterium]|nr:hypothetical protein [Alphaproteobacteria bacterium]
MKKYILILGVAGVALGSYCAYAANSATMTVTATIAHEVNIRNISNIDIGTITIDPSESSGSVLEDNCAWNRIGGEGNGIKSISGSPCGYFTADFSGDYLCGEAFSVTPEYVTWNNMSFNFGVLDTDTSGRCRVWTELVYSGSLPAQDTYNGSLTIEYQL